jgi:hypothetical protein
MRRRSLLLTTLAVAASAAYAPAASAVPPTPTTVNVVATPDQVKTGAPVTYTVTITPAPNSGTVSIGDNGTPVAGCTALPVTTGTVTCATTASADAGLRYIYAQYSGGGVYEPNGAIIFVPVTAQTTTVATASPKLAAPGETMTYKAVVTPRPAHGGIASCAGGCGEPPAETVDFAVDGTTVCTKSTVNTETGVASCTAPAPMAGGKHVLTAGYAGSEDGYLTTSAGTDDFAVKAPALSLSTGSLAFGPVTVGAEGAQQVTATSSGTGDLHVGALAVAGPFAATANGCDGATLAPGASCAITVAFRPAGAGATAGTLSIDSDAGAQAVALAGTGVAPATTPPPTGATLPPNTSTTFTATTSRAGSSSVTVPLRCPSGVACTLDGTVVISTDDLVKSKRARAAAAGTRTVARFAGVRVAAGKVKAIKLKLSPSFIKTARKRGVRFIHAVLTVNTTFTDGSHATRQERVTIRIPKAPKKVVKKKAAVAPRFTG